MIHLQTEQDKQGDHQLRYDTKRILVDELEIVLDQRPAEYQDKNGSDSAGHQSRHSSATQQLDPSVKVSGEFAHHLIGANVRACRRVASAGEKLVPAQF
jgi:hypothetical protein